MSVETAVSHGTAVLSVDSREVLACVEGAVPPELHVTVDAATSLDELGLDSLTRMDVVNAVEGRFNVRFPEDWLFDIETCGDLVVMVERARRLAG